MYTDEIINEGDESKALASLLQEDVCFLNTRKYICPITEQIGTTTVVFVNANDVFMWACSDAEDIEYTDGDLPCPIIDLYQLYKEKGYWGKIEWLCKVRNIQPQAAVKRDMIAEGYWTDSLENLTLNPY